MVVGTVSGASVDPCEDPVFPTVTAPLEAQTSSISVTLNIVLLDSKTVHALLTGVFRNS